MHQIRDTVADAKKSAIEYLRGHGFFDVNSYEPTLENDIHDIFACDRFNGLSKNTYENMKPGLRLASRFLEDERVLDYFWRQMRSEPQPVEPVAGAKVAAMAYRPRYSPNLHPQGTNEEWKALLDKLSKVVSWTVQEASRSEKDMPMGRTFAFEESRIAYSNYATKERTYKEVCKACDYDQVTRNAMVEKEIIAPRDNEPGWRTLVQSKETNPSVILHNFFDRYFSPTPKAVNDQTEPEKLQRLGAHFLFAHVLVHELAHCFNFYPFLKCITPDGCPLEAYASEAEAQEFHDSSNIISEPECGLSWERSVFGKQFIRFVKFTTSSAQDIWIYQDADDLAIPEAQDLRGHSALTHSNFDINGTQYNTTSIFTYYEKTLVPWQWISKWFQESHWSKDRTSEQIMAPPPAGWKMLYEIPDPQHQQSVRDEIVSIEIEVPEQEESGKIT